jgi:ATP adenylyltransferase
MDNLWAVWRRDFILGPKERGCIFCKRIRMKADRVNLILYRGKKCFVIMNRYPYNGGHLMVVPYAHKKDLGILTAAEASELFDLSRKSVEVLSRAMSVDGFNLGLNLGAVAGAGIENHLHVHVVPRFKGDTNFLPILGGVKVQSFSLEEIYDLLKPGFERLKGRH